MFRLLLAILIATSLIAEEKVTTHSIRLGEETLDYTATVVSGEISYIAYTKQTTEANRPITFAFNGGPGSSSVWLHMGTLGPRRVKSPEEGQSPLPPYQLVDNQETLLDLTDLVFIDPSGTGLSTADEKNFSVRNDIQLVGKCIRDYLTKEKRWNAPKYIAGESYGALRAAGVAEHLQEEFGVYFNGILFISPALDYQTFVFNEDNLLPYSLFLPTYATTAWYHGKYRPEATLEEVAQEAREFVYKTYAPFLLYPPGHEKEPIHKKLSHLTGLPLPLIEQNRGYITENFFLHHLLLDEQKMIGRYDGRLKGQSSQNFSHDPSISTVEGLFSAAFHDYLHRELDLPTPYTLMSLEVNSKWNHHDYNPWGYPNLLGGLRRALITNPALKIYVGCGYYDLATPFASVEYCFNHLDTPAASIQFDYYQGGHMYYLNPSERIKFKQDLVHFYKN